MKTKKICLLISLTLLLVSSSAFANLIANGDFETGALSPAWTTFTTGNGTIGSPSVTAFDVTGGGATNAAIFKVGDLNFTGLQEGGGILQDFTSGAGTLSATLDIAALGDTNDNIEGGVFSVILDNIVQDNYSFGRISANSILRSTLGFSTTVAAGTHELKILMTRPFSTGNTPTQYIDNVIVNGTPATSVPEPGILGLLGIGVGAMRLAARRVKR